MKFQCDKCSTGYSVPDEKVRGKRVRINCKRCAASIIIEGPPAESSPASPATQATGLAPPRPAQRTQMGGLEAPAALSAARGRELPKAPPIPAPARVLAGQEPWTVAITHDNPQRMTTGDIVDAYRSKVVTSKTLIWKKGMVDWKPPFDIPLVAIALRGAGFTPEPPPVSGPPGPISQDPEPDAPLIEEPADRLSASGTPTLPGFDDEDETTTILDGDRARALLDGELASSGARRATPRLPGKPYVPRAGAGRPPPKPAMTGTSAGRSQMSALPAGSDRSQDESGFDNENEATKVPEPNRAKELSDDARLPITATRDFDNEITQVVEPEESRRYLEQGGLVEVRETPALSPAEPGFDEEDDITRVATTEAAQELLRKSEAGTSENGVEPTVVVSDQSGASDAAEREMPSDKPPARPRYNPVHVQIQNEPTRIVRVRNKQNRNAVLIGFLIIIAASAAGGFLASRYLTPPPEPPPTPSQ